MALEQPTTAGELTHPPAEGTRRTSAADPSAPPIGLGARCGEWLGRRRAIARARAGAGWPPSTWTAACAARAERALDLAGRALDPVVGGRGGPAADLAVSILREATFWALAALGDEPGPADLGAALEGAPPDVVALAGGAESFAAIVRALLDRSYVDTARLPPAEQLADARRAERFAAALVARARRDPAAGEVARRRRRLGAAALAAGALAVVATAVATRAGADPDRALTWRASSNVGGWSIKGKLGDRRAFDLMMHTRKELRPWLEIDLGASRTIHQVEVVNRWDCCGERALPLVIEVGSGDGQWTEVARRTKAFDTWTAAFPARPARYVRLHVDAKTELHLQGVRVR